MNSELLLATVVLLVGAVEWVHGIVGYMTNEGCVYAAFKTWLV